MIDEAVLKKDGERDFILFCEMLIFADVRIYNSISNPN